VVLEFCTLSHDVDNDKEYIFETDTVRNKQEGNDDPEIAHLYIGPQGRANFNPR
jgi:hypothetical protein